MGDLVILTIYPEKEGQYPAKESVGFVAMALEENRIDLVLIPREDLGVEIPETYRVNVAFVVVKEISVCYYLNVPYDSTGLGVYTWRKMSAQ